MAVPEEIRKVPRPKNTYVIATGKNKDHYSVIEHIGCKRVGKRSLPISGKTVGHIIDGVYVPKEESKGNQKNQMPKTPKSIESMGYNGIEDQDEWEEQDERVESDLKDWASIELCDTLLKDQLEPLCQRWGEQKGTTLYLLGILKVCHPGNADQDLATFYWDSFLPEKYPQANLSKRFVISLEKELGNDRANILGFMSEHAQRVPKDHTILIDGFLCNNHSDGTELIVDMLAVDMEADVPVALVPYSSEKAKWDIYEDFLEKILNFRGTCLNNTGIPTHSLIEFFEEHPDYHFISPANNYTQLIDKYQMHQLERPMKGTPSLLTKKAKMQKQDCFLPGRQLYLYSMGDTSVNAEDAKHSFVTLISDHDWSPEQLNLAYQQMWVVEKNLRYYQRVHVLTPFFVNDTNAIPGGQLSNFLAILLRSRLEKKFISKGYMKDENAFDGLMYTLERAKKIKIRKNSWRLATLPDSEIKFLQDMGLLPVKRGVGRPRTNPYKIELERKRAKAKDASKAKDDKTKNL